METQELTGKKIAYYDGFSNTYSVDIIAEVNYDTDRDGYEIKGKGAGRGFIFLKSGDFETLTRDGKLTLHKSIDSCPFREEYEIQG